MSILAKWTTENANSYKKGCWNPCFKQRICWNHGFHDFPTWVFNEKPSFSLNFHVFHMKNQVFLWKNMFFYEIPGFLYEKPGFSMKNQVFQQILCSKHGFQQIWVAEFEFSANLVVRICQNLNFQLFWLPELEISAGSLFRIWRNLNFQLGFVWNLKFQLAFLTFGWILGQPWCHKVPDTFPRAACVEFPAGK